MVQPTSTGPSRERAADPGGTAPGGVIMRCLTRILIVLAVVATAGRESRAGEPDAAELAALIDRHVETRLESERVRPADPADDAEFLRRVYLDLHGVIPTAEQAAAFLAGPPPAPPTRLLHRQL